MQHVSAHKESQTESVYQWLSMHSPQMLTGLGHWLLAILSPLSRKQAVYHLPVVHCEENRQLRLRVLMWTLSGVLSSVFFGAEGALQVRDALSTNSILIQEQCIGD